MKILILILISFLISGCSVDYHLTISGDQIKEEIPLKSESLNDSKQIQENSWPVKVFYDDADLGENPEKMDGVTYYVDDLFLENNYYYRNLSYTFKVREFSRVNSIQSCYDHFYVTEDRNNDTITLSTSAEFLCMQDFPDLSAVHVFIESENPVVSHNAMQVHNNIYEWVIERENVEASGIIFTYHKEKGAMDQEEVDLGSRILLAILLLISFLCFVVFIIFYNVKKSRH